MQMINQFPQLATGVQPAGTIQPLLVGDAIPDLTLVTGDEIPFNLNLAVRQQATIIAFCRGDWCGYCKLQLIQLRELETELAELGCRLIVISPDRPQQLKSIARKYRVNYPLLSDHTMTAAISFGLAYQEADRREEFREKVGPSTGERRFLLPASAVFVVGTDGVIKFEHVSRDVKERLRPKVLLAAAAVYGGG